MQRSSPELPIRGRDALGETSQSATCLSPAVSRPLGRTLVLRSDESWVEISSQPSSSSLSSAAPDEIITTGLRVQDPSKSTRRRRRVRREGSMFRSLRIRPSSNGSSQEEYEESESESEEDGVMTSSNENVILSNTSHQLDPSALKSTERSEEQDAVDDEDDDMSTALGVPDEDQHVFTPQPNAFSHPPSSQGRVSSTPSSYFPQQSSRPEVHCRLPPSRRGVRQHSPYNMISPSHQADHDAALRASLSTLLSCAAAARALPKPSQQSGGFVRAGGPSRIEVGNLRIVPESVAMGSDDDEEATNKSDRGQQGVLKHRSSSSASSRDSTAPGQTDKGKRKATSSPSKHGQRERALKKTKQGLLDDSGAIISPTLLTWVVSAGVVVLVSAIGFSAGYAIGKEVGRAEFGAVGPGQDTTCSKEAVRGLRRFRWGTSGATSVKVL